MDDGLRWSLKKTGTFDIRSFYMALRDSSTVVFPWKSIWRTKAPRRACFFLWMAAWNKILTCDNLNKRGYTLTSWCCMCCSSGETVDHLLINCPMASAYGVGCSKLLGYDGLCLGQLPPCCLAGGMG